jgi:hypothetical protein
VFVGCLVLQFEQVPTAPSVHFLHLLVLEGAHALLRQGRWRVAEGEGRCFHVGIASGFGRVLLMGGYLGWLWVRWVVLAWRIFVDGLLIALLGTVLCGIGQLV